MTDTHHHVYLRAARRGWRVVQSQVHGNTVPWSGCTLQKHAGLFVWSPRPSQDPLLLSISADNACTHRGYPPIAILALCRIPNTNRQLRNREAGHWYRIPSSFRRVLVHTLLSRSAWICFLSFQLQPRALAAYIGICLPTGVPSLGTSEYCIKIFGFKYR